MAYFPVALAFATHFQGILVADPRHFGLAAHWAGRIHVAVADDPANRHLDPPAGITVLVDRSVAYLWPILGGETEVAVVNDKRIAIVNLVGFLAKSDGYFGSGLVALTEQLDEVTEDEDIDGIVLRIDSPGGTVAGTPDLAAAIRKARQSKPVFAYIEDLAAGSAYWIASQAERVYANVPTCLIGSIGTFVGLYDRAKEFRDAGILPVVIRAGEFKAAGFVGTEITPAQVAVWQDLVDASQAEFTAAIAKGRRVGLAKAKSWATGRVYMAADASAMGLIDGVKSFSETLGEMSRRVVSH